MALLVECGLLMLVIFSMISGVWVKFGELVCELLLVYPNVLLSGVIWLLAITLVIIEEFVIFKGNKTNKSRKF